MLVGLQARIYLAKSRVLKLINPELANEHAITAWEMTYSMGFINPDMPLGKLITDEPELFDAFHEGAGQHHALTAMQPGEFMRDIQFV